MRSCYRHIVVACCLLLVLPVGIFCRDDAPYALYLTWQSDPSTTMTVQWITKSASSESVLLYREEEGGQWKSAAGSCQLLPGSEDFYLHRVELQGLVAASAYLFSLGVSEGPLYKFRTAPDTLFKPLRFVVGGDIYPHEAVYCIETMKQAAKMDPHFVLLGGDLAYAEAKVPEGNPARELSRWMIFFSAWQQHMVTTDGYLIPMIAAIGNHDVNGRFGQPKENALFFYTFFPFPGRNGCNVLDVGNYLTIFVLDSGHTTPIPGSQTEWLEEQLEKRASVPHKFALYHVPAYPSVGKFDGKYSREIRNHWVPLFDRFQLSCAFENHDHAYKRTFPLKAGVPQREGVLYMGDGAWGVKRARLPKQPRTVKYLEKTARERHFLLVIVHKELQTYYAIKPNGDVFDTVSKRRQLTLKL